MNGCGFPVPAGRGGNRQGLQPRCFVPPISRAVRYAANRGVPTARHRFIFSEQGLKPLPIVVQSLRDEAAPKPRTFAKLQAQGQMPLGKSASTEFVPEGDAHVHVSMGDGRMREKLLCGLCGLLFQTLARIIHPMPARLTPPRLQHSGAWARRPPPKSPCLCDTMFHFKIVLSRRHKGTEK